MRFTNRYIIASLALIASPALAEVHVVFSNSPVMGNVLFDKNDTPQTTIIGTVGGLDVIFTGNPGLFADASGQADVQNAIWSGEKPDDGTKYLVGTISFELQNGYTFTEAGFNLPGIPGPPPPPEATSMDIQVFGLNGVLLYSGNLNPFAGNGENRINVSGDAGEKFTKILFTLKPDDSGVQALEQVRLTGITSAVPEPATWALMLGGFGVLGAAIRRRNKARITYA